MLTANKQPPEKPVQSDGMKLDVHSIFDTIQGEGPFAGHRAIFLRLAGCNLQCLWCDTEYTNGRETMSVNDIVASVRELRQGDPTKGMQERPLVVITGGEPFRQVLTPIVQALQIACYTVQVETNGTLYQSLPVETAVVCSPKTPKVHPNMKHLVTAWKYVLDHKHVDADGLPSKVLGVNDAARPTNAAPVYIQPMDSDDSELNQKHTDAAVASCRTHGHILCLQLHKFIGVE